LRQLIKIKFILFLSFFPFFFLCFYLDNKNYFFKFPLKKLFHYFFLLIRHFYTLKKFLYFLNI